MNRTDQSSPTPHAAAGGGGADVAARKRSLGASFPIVGIGASAGGLEAFTLLLEALPLDTGMGFVLVQHLDPEHESALTHILSRATKLPVREVKNNQPVQANHVYVIPPDTNLSIAQGVLQLAPRPRTGKPHKPIDAFFESLAADQHDRAIGVVLSGTASDGTLGLEAIKAEGGITFAQDDSARHDSMPRSAVAAGCVDLVLAPADIAKEIARIARHPYGAGQPLALPTRAENDRAQATAHEDDETPLPSGGRIGEPGALRKPAKKARGESKAAQTEEDGYRKILLLLRNHSGVDFSLYRSSTIQRRIGRRLVLNKQDTLEDYARFLRGNSKELDALYSDVLISVTSFFRNPEMFDVLQRKVLPELFKQRGDDPLRVWVLGCSTGQEAYSIAMSFVEAADKARRMRRLQVFATDLNDTLLDKARHGLYAKSLAEDISPQRLQRFFIEEEGGYRIGKALREMVVFARQNLISDPPFSRMDLISCRNLLIYLEPSLQKKALPTFHYALKPEGFLLLGASESIGGFTDLFEPIDKKHKIYARKTAPTPAFHLPVKAERGERSAAGARGSAPAMTAPEAPPGLGGELSAQREADRIAINQFAPPSVLVNAELQVVQFRGPTGAYLEPPAGKASFDVLKMAREGLMLPLRAAINQARKENKTARRDNVRLQQNGTTRSVNLEVIPLKNLRERCFLIVFEKADQTAGARAPEAPPRAGKAAKVTAKAELRRSTELETELAETREYLQSIQEQHEAANEELQAANEEVQSANEELQSVNEELETSKEELESANEELITVNEEMNNRNVELNRLNNDLVNLQTSTRQCVLLLGRDLTIRRFSVQAEKQFELLASDIGRRLGHVRHNLAFADAAQSPLDLEALATAVIADVREQEHEVRDKTGRWYSLRLRPYMTLDNKIDGAVLVLSDIDSLKRSQEEIGAARDYAEDIIETVREPLLVLDQELRVASANHAFYDTFRVSPSETVGRFIHELGERQWDIPRLRKRLAEILPQNTSVEEFLVEHDFEQLGRRSMLLNARKVVDSQQKTERILLAIDDITDRKRAEAAVRASEARYRQLFESAKDGILILDVDTATITEANPFIAELLDYPHADLLGKELWEIGLFKDKKASKAAVRELQARRYLRYDDLPLETQSGRQIDVEMVSNIYGESDHPVIQCNIRDITERKRLQDSEHEGQLRLEFVLGSMPQKIFTAEPNGDVDYFNPQWTEFTGLPFEQIKGWGWKVFIHPHDLDETLRRWKQCVDTGQTFVLEHRFRRADGEYRWHLSRALPLRDAAGEIVMWAGSNTDIHEQLETANTLRQYTADLSEADRRKNEFLAMLAHELRNPLAPIRNALQIMRLTGSKPEVVGSASTMLERQVGQMVRLVDDLLDVSRITRGKIELRKAPVELASVVYQAVEAARPLSDSMNHELTVTLPPEPVYLDADPTRLAQIVGNLLNNASKFSRKRGRIWLTVEQDGAQAVLRVRDLGIGIAADQLPHIFDMFVQADTSLERAIGGLGIGLTLVKNLVEMHGGTVEARSDGADRGSEFIVRLPMVAEIPASALQQTPSAPAITTTCRILVVDDNRDSAESLVMLLTLAGNEMRAAYDGLEAVEAAATFKPDVVLLDIGLPKLNGYEVARRIRQQPEGKNMRLVALTGWGQDEDRQKSKEAGFDAHLVKPVDHAALQTLLVQLGNC